MNNVNDSEKKEIIEDMNKKADINFTDYAALDQEYTKRELADIYKKIITDITKDNK